MAGGVIFNYRGSWCAEGLRTSWESAWRITGSLGTLLWDGADDIRAEVVRGLPQAVPRQRFRRQSHLKRFPGAR